METAVKEKKKSRSRSDKKEKETDKKEKRTKRTKKVEGEKEKTRSSKKTKREKSSKSSSKSKAEEPKPPVEEKGEETKTKSKNTWARRTAQRKLLAKATEESIQQLKKEKGDETAARNAEIDEIVEKVTTSTEVKPVATKIPPSKNQIDDFLFADDDDDEDDYDDDDDEDDETPRPKVKIEQKKEETTKQPEKTEEKPKIESKIEPTNDKPKEEKVEQKSTQVEVENTKLAEKTDDKKSKEEEEPKPKQTSSDKKDVKDEPKEKVKDQITDEEPKKEINASENKSKDSANQQNESMDKSDQKEKTKSKEKSKSKENKEKVTSQDQKDNKKVKSKDDSNVDNKTKNEKPQVTLKDSNDAESKSKDKKKKKEKPATKTTRKRSGTQRIKDVAPEELETRGESPRKKVSEGLLVEKKTGISRAASSSSVSRQRARTTVSSPLSKQKSDLKKDGSTSNLKTDNTKKENEKEAPKAESQQPSSSSNDRNVKMIEVLFKRLMTNGVLLEPFLTVKKLFDEGDSIENIEKAFDDYEKTKHIIKVPTFDDDDDDDDDENREESEEEIEEQEEDFNENDFTKEPADFIEYDDQWTLANAGGCFNYPTWRKNPQYLLFIDKTSQVEISLTQIEEPMEPLLHIGFYVFYGNKQQKRVIEKEELIDKCPLDEQKIVSKQVKLAGSTEPYMIVPCSFDPFEVSKFKLAAKIIEGASKLKFTRLLKQNDWKKMIIKGKWRKSNAGGCRNYSSHLLNDQFLISSNSRCSGRIILQYRHKENVDELGIYILSAPNDLSHKIIHTLDAPLISKSGFSLPNEALSEFRIDSPSDRLIIIPCTFEPERFATYRLIILSDNDITIQPLSPPKYREVTDEWKGETAVGCLNHSKWRFNPQYQLTTNGNVQIQLQKTEENNESVIGFYVLKSPNGSRQLEVNKDNFITKASFMNSQSVTAQIDFTSLFPQKNPPSSTNENEANDNNDQIIEEPQTFVIVPCTFRPGFETSFTLRAFCSHETSVLELSEANNDWIESMVTGKWQKGTAGGCINYASWRNNPQIKMKAEEDGEIVLALEQEHLDSNQQHQQPTSIGFYITKSHENENNKNKKQRIWSMEASDIIHKAPFKKNNLNLTRMQVEKGQSYTIIPSAFSPWDECSYKFYAYGKSKVTLKRLHRTQEDKQLRVKGKWTKESAGGCMANTTWPKNPHLIMKVSDKPVQMEIMLQQFISKADTPSAIGFCITKSDVNGFPAISSVDDILYKINYEEAADISMNVCIPPSDTPYVITPSTYHPDVTCRFALQIFTDDSNCVSLSDPHHNFESGEDDFDAIDLSDAVNQNPSSITKSNTASRLGIEKIEETLEEEELISEQIAINSPHPHSNQKSSNRLPIDSSPLSNDNSNNDKIIDNSDNIPSPPVPPPNVPPPPTAPPLLSNPKPVGGGGLHSVTLKSTPTNNPKPVGSTSNTANLFDQIRKGTSLKTADQQKPLAEPEFTWTPFNVDKIVARRAALEFSDDEDAGGEWDDDWDDDWDE